MCMCVREVSKCLYQAMIVMCMCVREVSKFLYQARIVMCMCVREVHTHHCPAWHIHFDTSLTNIHITDLDWYRHFDTSSDVHVC
jgi:hypothetical protein